MTEKFKAVVADPPWRYQSAATKADAGKHYPTMSLSEIAALPIPLIAEPDSHLWLWTTNAFMRQAHELASGWGFQVMTIVTWCKKQPGVGHYLRNNTEHCLFATRGRPLVPTDKPLSTWFVWPRSQHSQKPDAFYDLVEQVSPAPRIEIFARSQRLGWASWGNESFCHVSLDNSEQ